MSNRVKIGIISVVTLAWIVNFFGSALIPNYKPNPGVDAPFMAVIGYMLTTLKDKDKDKKNGDGNGSARPE